MVQRVEQRDIELEQGLAAGADHERRAAAGPGGCDRGGERLGVGEFPAAGSVGPEEVGIAERADRVGPVLLPPGPEITSGKPAEHRGAAGVGALSLKGVEDLFHGVGHWERARSQRAREPGSRRLTGRSDEPKSRSFSDSTSVIAARRAAGSSPAAESLP